MTGGLYKESEDRERGIHFTIVNPKKVDGSETDFMKTIKLFSFKTNHEQSGPSLYAEKSQDAYDLCQASASPSLCSSVSSTPNGNQQTYTELSATGFEEVPDGYLIFLISENHFPLDNTQAA